MAQDKQALIQLVNMLAGTLQGIGQQRQQRSRDKAQMGLQKEQLEMSRIRLDNEIERMKQETDYNKAILGLRQAEEKRTAYEFELDQETKEVEAEWQMEREAKTETTGDVTKRAAGELTEGTGDGMGLLNSIAAITKNFPTSTRTMMEGPQTTPGMTKAEFIARESAEGTSMAALGNLSEPSAITMADFQLYSVLGPDNLPSHMEAYRGAVEREHNYLLESREPDYFAQAQEAFNLGQMAYSTEGEMAVPEHLKGFAEFDMFFDGGKNQAKVAMTPRGGGGGYGGGAPPADIGDGGPMELDAIPAIEAAFVMGGEVAGREEAEKQWAGLTTFYKTQEGAAGLYEWFKVNLGVLNADTMSPDELHNTFMQYVMQQAGYREPEAEERQPSTFKGVSSTFRGGP